MRKKPEVWSGPRVMQFRTYMAEHLTYQSQMGKPVLCYRGCGKPVFPWDQWDIDHKVSIDEGGRMWDWNNMAPSHSSCNRGHGAQITNNKKRAKKSRLRKW